MNKPIRILHVIGMLNRGGAETMIMNLYRHIDTTRVQFDFVQNEGPEAAYDAEIRSLGGRIYHCPRYRGKNHLAYTAWWQRFFKEHGGEYAAVHGHIGSTAAIYLSIAKKYGLYTIAHSHSAGKGTLFYRILAYPTRYVADQFFACSADAAVSRYGVAVSRDESRCRMLNNAIDTLVFCFDPERRQAMRQKLHLADHSFVIGHVGRFMEVKNHLFLIEAFEWIREYHPESVLLLVGDGPLRPQIEAVIAEKNLQKAVILAGVQKDVSAYYQVMDAYVMPSVFEGVPVSLVEAQAAGLPCCVSTGVPREAAITDLVQFRSLEDSPEVWAKWVIERSEYVRRDTSEELCRAGYDIAQTAKWLEDYYLKAVNRHGERD